MESIDRCDVLIVTALKDELDALRAVEDNSDIWRSFEDEQGYELWYRNFLSKKSRPFVVLAARTAMGPRRSATWIGKLYQQYKPRCISMCGICAGWRDKTMQGDVVFARKVYEYDEGKLISEGNSEKLLSDIETYKPKNSWIRWAEDNKDRWADDYKVQRPSSLRKQKEWFLRTLYSLTEPSLLSGHAQRDELCPDFVLVRQQLEKAGLLENDRLALTEEGSRRAVRHLDDHPNKISPDEPFRVHVATIATGNKVVENRNIFKNLAEGGVRSVQALEMEAVCVGAAADLFDVEQWLVVKSVQDYADEEKDDRFRAFACRSSAEFLVFCLRHLYQEKSCALVSERDQSPGTTEKKKGLCESAIDEDRR